VGDPRPLTLRPGAARGGLVDELAGAIAAGDAVLFTGAGFSRGARSVRGVPLPTSRDLVELMWPIAFGDEPRDPSALADVYACAVDADERRTGEVLRSHLHVDADALPASYDTWFSMPWHRVYTLNADDLEEAAARRFRLPQEIRPVSALRDGLPPRAPELLCVHLNGRIADYPDMTFSQQQYGQRVARPDPWYQHLAADLSAHTVLFVGTLLNESPLWQQFALHLGDRPPADRPRSFLVSHNVPVARRRVLERLNVEWVPMDQERFAAEHLGAAAAAGHDALGRGRLVDR
jgi:hypothetical protein